LILLGISAVWGADPQPYRVDIAATKDSALNETLKSTSELLTLRKSAPVGPFGLIGRARGDVQRLKAVLESVGYYQGNVSITIDALPLDDPALGEELTQRPRDQDAQVNIAFDLGPLYRLGTIDIVGEAPPAAAASLKLASGAPAVAADVLAAAERLRRALQDDGYAYARVDPPHAREDATQHLLNVTVHVTTGERRQVGDVRITGLENIKASFVRRRLLVHTGDQYRATAIEAARRDLLGQSVFSRVSVHIDPAPDPNGRVPVTFEVRERKPHVVGFTGAWSLRSRALASRAARIVTRCWVYRSRRSIIQRDWSRRWRMLARACAYRWRLRPRSHWVIPAPALSSRN
jgi:translocation and assembly module TamA